MPIYIRVSVKPRGGVTLPLPLVDPPLLNVVRNQPTNPHAKILKHKTQPNKSTCKLKHNIKYYFSHDS